MSEFSIRQRSIGYGHPTYIIAEISANHHHRFERAVELIKAAKDAGADAVKLQTYTPDTMTIDCNNQYFQIGKGTIWEGKHLYKLYQEAYTPWEWHPELIKAAQQIGIDCFSTPFDHSAVRFLEELDVPAYKVASFELIDVPLLREIGQTGKPVIMSTGMANEQEIQEAVDALTESGCPHLALLKCTSAYPADPKEMNLLTIHYLMERFHVVAGLSDHTLGLTAAIASVALGGGIIEKHLTLSRDEPGPDSRFSLEVEEFKAMVQAVRETEKALGTVRLGQCPQEEASAVFRRSLFVVQDMQVGDLFTEKNVRSIRPGYGLAPKHLHEVLGKIAVCDVPRGTPMSWELCQESL